MAMQFSYFKQKKVHLGVCGSVAAYKALDILRLFVKADIAVSCTLSAAAEQFVRPLSFVSLGATKVYGAMFAQEESPFDHLEPGSYIDAFVVAPITAQTLAKLARGDADTMLSAQALSCLKPLVLAPAMNPRMWAHPATQENVEILQKRGALFVDPAGGLVACQEEGIGKLASIEDIYLTSLRALAPQDLKGKNVLVTLGPTREKWDAIRYWSNPSTGYMGACLAVAAWLRGATVHAVMGPGSVRLPQCIEQLPVESAREMFEQADSLWDRMDVGIFTAAVADFRPMGGEKEKKYKKAGKSSLHIQFEANQDIIHSLGMRKREGQKILGFAAETENLPHNALDKLKRKNMDLIAANFINQPNSGFASLTNSLYVLDRSGRVEEWEQLSKTDLSWRLLDWLVDM